MKISSLSRQRVKFYFDIVCPNTWASYQMIQRSQPALDVDFRPICDWKVNLKRNMDIFESKKESGEIPKHEKPRKLITHEEKEVPEHLVEELPTDWQEIFAKARENGSVLPQLFLTSIREHFPELLPAAVEKVGSRLWNERLPIHKGCYLSTCAREIGMSFVDSEFVISRLSHRNYRQRLTDISNEAVSHGAAQSPLFVVDDDSCQPAAFTDVRELFQSTEKSRING